MKYHFLALVLGVTSLCFICMTVVAQAQDIAPQELVAMKAKYRRPNAIPFPKSNPYSKEKEELGKTLFFDARLSHDGTKSCASCHNPGFAWTDGLPKAFGNKTFLSRKSMSVQNLAWDKLFFWDGRISSLEAQALSPISFDKEMNMSLGKVVPMLESIQGYKDMFKKAFPESDGKILLNDIARAIATFERKLVSGPAPLDAWIDGDEDAISESAQRGFVLFNTKAQCASCHQGWNFASATFHDIGLPISKTEPDLGRGKIVPREKMKYAFKTVGLRNIALRPPYMHDGSLKTLKDVIDFKNNGFEKRPSLSDEVDVLHLNEQEKEDLVEFMKTLTGDDPPLTFPVFPQ